MDETLKALIEEYKRFPQVSAISVGGSRCAATADDASDIDLEVFVSAPVPVAERLEIIKKYSSKYEVGGEYFGFGDEFYVDAMKRDADVLYAERERMENIVENVWEKHIPANGYTTCFLFTLKNCFPVYDRDGWLAGIKKRLDTPYPKELKRNVIKRNLMLLKDKPFASYYNQIEKALGRDDFNSVNHRTAAFMASYFDIIFANNEMLHPGEKKLVKYALEHCKILPKDFSENITRLIVFPNPDILDVLDDMVRKLKACIASDA